MPPEFQSFVVFAEMRTGSNFLEANLNQLEGVACHGEAFNPHFLGYPENKPILGVDHGTRDRKPEILLDAIRNDTAQLGSGLIKLDPQPNGRKFDHRQEVA